MTSVREQRREHHARAKRLSHPLHERLIPVLDGAPEAVRAAQADAIKAVEIRRDLVAKYREAEQAEREAPARDEQAGREALAAGKAAPKPTVDPAKAKRIELRRQFNLAKENEAEALDRLAEVTAQHGDAWQVTLHEELSEKAKAAAELSEKAQEAWAELDLAYVTSRWLYTLDPERPKPIAKVASLQVGDVRPVRVLGGLAQLATQAPDRAVEGESARRVRATARAERKARRAQKVAA